MSNHVGPVRMGGDIVAAVILSQDVTEAKIAQLDLVAAQRLASVGTLAAGVAHEINTPVQFVRDSIHFLREASARHVRAGQDTPQALQALVERGAAASELGAALRPASTEASPSTRISTTCARTSRRRSSARWKAWIASRGSSAR